MNIFSILDLIRRKRELKIVVTGDILRTTTGDPNQFQNVKNLYEELYQPLCEATGQEPELRYRQNASDGGLSIIRQWYRIFDLSPSIDSWASIYANTNPPDQLVDELRHDYENTLVIGFELPPIMKAALNAMNSPWIEVFWHPIRFLEDLCLVFHPSWKIPKRLFEYSGLMSDEGILRAVDRIKSYYTQSADNISISDSVVFLAQIENDRNLITQGRFYQFEDIQKAIMPIFSGVNLFIKPHPREINTPIIEELKSRFNAKTIMPPIYELIAKASRVEFVTISSSSGTEAQQFGHPVRFLDKSKDQMTNGLCSLWAHRTPNFWRSLLSKMTSTTSKQYVDESSFQSSYTNRLRHRWNYHNEASLFW